ncbi:uncharacterized protein LOC106716504 [Papilio machaon]|uniref:uncharacterized protein LOC106716504 n=1 Tax=Papilio machaon TaxID=76193 RepID=UPI001E66546D|nr:uncharacterized protein LOC106716504 [Papilio machaon]
MNVDEKAPFFVFMNVVITLTHILIGAIAFNAIFFANLFQIRSSFQQHIYLCVIGYILLMSQAVLSMNPYASWAKVLSYENKKMIHWLMQILGSVLAIAGSIVKLADRNTNFRSAHGILGLVAMLFTIASLISGIVNLFSMNFSNNINMIKIGHSVLGALALSTAYLSLCFGFHDVYRVVYGNNNANLSINFTVVTLIGVLTSTCINTVRRIVP